MALVGRKRKRGCPKSPKRPRFPSRVREKFARGGGPRWNPEFAPSAHGPKISDARRFFRLGRPEGWPFSAWQETRGEEREIEQARAVVRLQLRASRAPRE